jgi:PAS domain S-box-containing protein
VLIVVGTAALSTMQALNEAWRWEKHTYQVIVELDKLLSNLVDVETADRGYAISGNQKFLEPFNNAFPQIDGRIQNLKRLTIDNAIQQRQLELLGPLIEQRIAEAQRVVDARAKGYSEAAQAQVSGGEGKRIMDAIRQVITEMEKEEQRLLTVRGQVANVAVLRMQGILFGSGALGVLIVVLSIVLTARENRKRRQAEASAYRTLSLLDFTLDAMLIFEASTLRFFYVNKGAIQQLGYTREELLGMTPLDLEPQLDEACYCATIAPLIDGTLVSQTKDTVYHRKDGTEVPVEIVIQAGEVVAGKRMIVAIARDITDRQQAEKVANLLSRLNSSIWRMT